MKFKKGKYKLNLQELAHILHRGEMVRWRFTGKRPRVFDRFQAQHEKYHS